MVQVKTTHTHKPYGPNWAVIFEHFLDAMGKCPIKCGQHLEMTKAVGTLNHKNRTNKQIKKERKKERKERKKERKKENVAIVLAIL